jgi:hypothetical protein
MVWEEHKFLSGFFDLKWGNFGWIQWAFRSSLHMSNRGKRGDRSEKSSTNAEEIKLRRSLAGFTSRTDIPANCQARLERTRGGSLRSLWLDCSWMISSYGVCLCARNCNGITNNLTFLSRVIPGAKPRFTGASEKVTAVSSVKSTSFPRSQNAWRVRSNIDTILANIWSMSAFLLGICSSVPNYKSALLPVGFKRSVWIKTDGNMLNKGGTRTGWLTTAIRQCSLLRQYRNWWPLINGCVPPSSLVVWLRPLLYILFFWEW